MIKCEDKDCPQYKKYDRQTGCELAFELAFACQQTKVLNTISLQLNRLAEATEKLGEGWNINIKQPSL